MGYMLIALLQGNVIVKDSR